MSSTRLMQTPRAHRVASLLTIAAMVLALLTAARMGRAAAAQSGCHPYPDVTSSNSACANIAWLKTKDITKPADGRYHPTADVTRGSMVAFLFRLTHPGKRSPKCTSRPFPDVSTGNVFCGYIRWAKTHHIAFGYANGKYGPNDAVTRGAMAAYLHRIATGKPASECIRQPFKDVKTTDTFCGVITWAKANGITYGVGDGKYGTAAPVTRQAMASFLHRIAGYDPAHDKATTITTVTPFTSDGRVRFPLASDEYQTDAPGLNCFHSPVTRAADAYQCSYDRSSVCWTDPAGASYMYCMGDAADTAVLRVYPPSNTGGSESDRSDPWRIVLDDGTACDYQYDFYDTYWLSEPKGWRYTYECSGGRYEVVTYGSHRSVDTSTWTTHVLKSRSDTVTTVHVKSAIYAGAAPHVAPAKTGSACPSRAVLQKALQPGEPGATITDDEIRCSGDWATAGVAFNGNGEAGLFHKVGGGWVRSTRTSDCTLPSPVPAALYRDGCMVS